MKCCKCEATAPDDARFCPECGSNLTDVESLRQRCLKYVEQCEKSIRRGEGSRPFIRRNVFDLLPEWKQAAELGVREAQWLLGRCYDEGLGVERSDIHAIGWHLRAAEQGYPAAQNHMGSCYQNGDGVPQDEAEAVEWYRKAAEQGYAIAQANLGWCYDAGCGVAVDEAEALKWHRKAALQDDETGQYNLGVHYEWGSAVEEDKEKAAKWYRRAAAHGYERAAEALKRLTDEVAESDEDSFVEAAEAEQKFRTACKDALADGKVTTDEKQKLNTLAESLKMPAETVKKMFEEEKETFQREMKRRLAREAELKFRIACKNALADGKVTVDQKKELKALAKSLKMPSQMVKQIFEDEKRIFKTGQNVAPTRTVELQFRKACKKALADGRVTMVEERQLKNLAKYFKISNQAMKDILRDEVAIFKQEHKARPTKAVELQFRRACKKALADGKVTPDEERELKSLARFFKMPTLIMKEIL
ncbi:MAG: SEL1-like repeat protein, partial [Phycisphaerales bacterium]